MAHRRFFQFNHNLKNEMSVIFDAYMDVLMESDEEDENEAIGNFFWLVGWSSKQQERLESLLKIIEISSITT